MVAAFVDFQIAMLAAFVTIENKNPSNDFAK